MDLEQPFKVRFREGLQLSDDMICCECRLCRELVQVGKCQAGSRETKWSLDASVALIDVAMAEEIFATIGPQTSVVTCFLVLWELSVQSAVCKPAV
jgi:hypothetical protein